MALQDYNSLLIEHLGELQAAAELADGDEIAIWLGVLREEQLDPELLAAVQALFDDGQYDGVLQWATERLAELSSDENPFAGAFDFDVDDVFFDVEDTGFREPEADFAGVDLGLADLDSSVKLLEPDYNEVPVDEAPASRPHVLSGRFNVIGREDVAADSGARSLADSLDEVARQHSEEALDPDRQTRPNMTPDLAEMRAATRASDEAFDDAPMFDRLRGSDISDEMATTPPEVSEAEEPEGEPFRSSADDGGSDAEDEPPSSEISIEIDLVESPPEDVTPAAAPIEFKPSGGFDFGFDDDEFASEAAVDRRDAGVREPTKPAVKEPEPASAHAHRDRQLTPLKPLQAQDPEDMFFELAEALAADSSGAELQYRGEPIRGAHAAQTNPFGNNAPTGTAHMPLAAESMAGAHESHIHTNMNAILLEARRLRATGELGAALDITKKVISRGPNADADLLLDQIESELESSSLAKLGALTRTPKLAIDMGALSELSLDHRAGYIISQVDGFMTYEDLIELSGMSRLDTLAVFCDLLDLGVIVA